MNNPGTSPPAVLGAIGLTKSYLSGERRIQVVNGASLSVAMGETISIRGESGSGKTTILNLLAGLDAPDAGEVHWHGQSIHTVGTGELASRRARMLGLVFQSYYLIPELDALANVLFAARIVGKAGRSERERAATLLASMGLAERTTHLPSQLSGGERQRVAIARALMNSPKVILADEPTGNLDEHTGDAVIDLLVKACEQQATALVLVTHNAAHAAKCRRQLRLHDGKLA